MLPESSLDLGLLAETLVAFHRDFASVPPDVDGLLREFSAPITEGREPIVIPSLLRFDALVAAVQQRITASAQALPYAVAPRTDERTRGIIDDFLRTIPAMVVAAPLIAAALKLELTRTSG